MLFENSLYNLFLIKLYFMNMVMGVPFFELLLGLDVTFCLSKRVRLRTRVRSVTQV